MGGNIKSFDKAIKVKTLHGREKYSFYFNLHVDETQIKIWVDRLIAPLDEIYEIFDEFVFGKIVLDKDFVEQFKNEYKDEIKAFKNVKVLNIRIQEEMPNQYIIFENGNTLETGFGIEDDRLAYFGCEESATFKLNKHEKALLNYVLEKIFEDCPQ